MPLTTNMLCHFHFAGVGLLLGHFVLASSLPLSLISGPMGGVSYSFFLWATKKCNSGCMAHIPLANRDELAYSCIDRTSALTVEACVYNVGIVNQG
jgi:hypothetical protein